MNKKANIDVSNVDDVDCPDKNESNTGNSMIFVPSPPETSAESGKGVLATKRRLIIKSIKQRVTFNYVLYSVTLLVVLLLIFVLGLTFYYDNVVERETEDVWRNAVAAFPKRDDNSMQYHYKGRLAEMARVNKPTVIAVFSVEENGDTVVKIIVDDMGNDDNDHTELFDAVTGAVQPEFWCSDKTERVHTMYGVFVCRGSIQKIESDDVANVSYLLVMKPYDVYDSIGMKLVYMLMICTAIALVFSCAYAFFISRKETRQLADFSKKAKRIAAGDYSVEFSGYGYEEYEYLAKALNAATANLKKTEEMQRDIIANVSHDIRTPLTMIRAYAEMLRDMPVDPQKRQKTADVIISEADRLTALTGDILDFSRLQAGVTPLNMVPCDLSEIAVSVVKLFDIIKERNGITITTDIDEGLAVRCDANYIERVFYNLLNNAINYCGDDKTVIISVKSRGGNVRVEVIDHGQGIDPSEIESVWNRYYKSSNRQHEVVGSGLGLSICKIILTEHKSEFGVISELGKGSTFWFELPLEDGGGGIVKESDKSHGEICA